MAKIGELTIENEFMKKICTNIQELTSMG